MALTTPALRKCTFAELCKRCQLTLRDVVGFWRNYQLQRGMMKMMNHVPEVMEDTAIDAKTRVVTCSNCEGTGKELKNAYNKMEGTVCGACHGDGTIRLIGDKDARNLVFESTGLRKSGIQMMQNVNINSLPTLEDSIKEMEGAIDITPEAAAAPAEEEKSDA